MRRPRGFPASIMHSVGPKLDQIQTESGSIVVRNSDTDIAERPTVESFLRRASLSEVDVRLHGSAPFVILDSRKAKREERCRNAQTSLGQDLVISRSRRHCGQNADDESGRLDLIYCGFGSQYRDLVYTNKASTEPALLLGNLFLWRYILLPERQ
jgi:hypothetical protein